MNPTPTIPPVETLRTLRKALVSYMCDNTPMSIEECDEIACVLRDVGRLSETQGPEKLQGLLDGSWVVVPLEPTDRMSTAGKHIIKGSQDCGEVQFERFVAISVYRGMISAAQDKE